MQENQGVFLKRRSEEWLRRDDGGARRTLTPSSRLSLAAKAIAPKDLSRAKTRARNAQKRQKQTHYASDQP